MLDRDDVELKRVTAELAETIVEGADIESHVVDVTDRQAVDAAVASTMDTFGRIDALAHVAGILDTGSVLDSDPDQWRKIFGVNVFGLLNVLQSVGLEMRRRRAGAMVVVSSNAAGVPRIGMGAYGSSKAAATMLVRTAGLELAADGIRVNVVAPGSTDTAMQRSLWSDFRRFGCRRGHRRQSGELSLGIPLGKLATADDIADSVHFLLSDRAAHITMQALYVDGGATLKA